MCPTPAELSSIGDMFTDGHDCVRKLFDVEGREANSLSEEFNDILRELESRIKIAGPTYPIEFGLGRESLFALYSIIRKSKPLKVLETGVANGSSTFVILKALETNHKGTLSSIDVNSNVANCLNDEDKHRWDFFLLEEANRTCLERIMSVVGNIELFIHDSNHNYYWQMMEYELSYQLLDRNGLMFSDDVDHSYAFFDFVRRNDLSASIIFDRSKFTGIAKERSGEVKSDDVDSQNHSSLE